MFLISLRLLVTAEQNVFGTYHRRDLESQLFGHGEYGRLHKHYIRRVTMNRDGWMYYLPSTTVQLRQNEGRASRRFFTE